MKQLLLQRNQRRKILLTIILQTQCRTGIAVSPDQATEPVLTLWDKTGKTENEKAFGAILSCNKKERLHQKWDL